MGKINIFYLFLGILLVVPNYYFEIKKWHILGGLLEKRNFKDASVEVLRGLRMGVVTPLMLGDYWGRSKDYDSSHRGTVVLYNLFNSFVQTWTSLHFGGLALLFWYFTGHTPFMSWIGLSAITVLLASFIGLFLLLGLKINFLERIKVIRPYLDSMGLSLTIKTKVLKLSLIRTIIYNLQYIFFYKAFAIALKPVIYFIGINLLLLVKTVGGGLNIFGDLTLRELVSYQFFQFYDVDLRAILLATFVIWLVNVFSPIICGIFLEKK